MTNTLNTIQIKTCQTIWKQNLEVLWQPKRLKISNPFLGIRLQQGIIFKQNRSLRSLFSQDTNI